jgi:hypothetical protein
MTPVPWNQPHQLSMTAEIAATDALRLRLRGEHGWGRSWGFRQTYYDYLGVQPNADARLGASLQTPADHTLAPHTRFDLGGRYVVRWKGVALEAHLDVINVLDRRNPFDWGVRPDGGRTGGVTRSTRRLPGRRVVGGLSVRY